MTNFTRARASMVQSQLAPQGVVTAEILAAFDSVPRELFVPAEYQAFCYSDEDLALPGGRCLFEPALLARLFQALQIGSQDRVLYVGGCTGYGAAVAAGLAAQVTNLECDDQFGALAHAGWQELGLTNVNRVVGRLSDGYVKNAPYDVILVEGAAAAIPSGLTEQLAATGRMTCLLVSDRQPMGQVYFYERMRTGTVGGRALFDAFAPYLPGLGPKQEFTFA